MPAPITMRMLRDYIESELAHEGESFLDRKLHVVFYGETRPSFNLPATQAHTGANFNDFNIVTEEARDERSE